MHTEILEQVSERSGLGTTTPGTKSPGQERVENDGQGKDKRNNAMGRDTKKPIRRAS